MRVEERVRERQRTVKGKERHAISSSDESKRCQRKQTKQQTESLDE